MNEEEINRMQYFIDRGQVSMVGNVSIERNKKIGNKITIDEELHSSEEINQKIGNRIIGLIDKKMAKEKPSNTALLVYFDDYTAFRYDRDASKPQMEIFLDSLNIQWRNKYSVLYIVGTSGKSFYERR